jgi:two-component system, OmpR family, response regulator ChvI
LYNYLKSLQSNRNKIKEYPYRILLVDDEPDVVLGFEICLEDNGFEVDSFNDPILALSSFKQGLYSLALLDIRMPKLNGFELYREIRKIDDKVKICFMTAFDIQNEQLKEVLPTLDLDEPIVIRKPIRIDDFIAKIKTELS